MGSSKLKTVLCENSKCKLQSKRKYLATTYLTYQEYMKNFQNSLTKIKSNHRINKSYVKAFH